MEQSKTPRHVSIDLETMGKTPECAIVSIGAVIFDPRYNVVTQDKFYTELNWQAQDRFLCPDTTAWWQRQSPKAKAALNGSEDLRDQLIDLAFWLPSDCKVWGNGATFDISILENAYRQHGLEVPWKFWNVRDMRTIKDMYESSRGGLNRKSGGTLHNALDDANFQAESITYMWKRLLTPTVK